MLVFLVVILFLFLFCLSSAKLILVFHRVYEDDYIGITVVLLSGLVRLKFKIPYLDIFISRRLKSGISIREEMDSKKGRTFWGKKIALGGGNIKDLYCSINNAYKLYKGVGLYIISKTKIEYIKWHTEIGFNNAALTAIVSGIIYAIKGNIITYLSSFLNHDNIDINVKTSYNKEIFETDLNCIIRIKIANIIIAGIRIAYLLLVNGLFRKGGEHDERTSHSGLNENYNG